MKRFLSTILAIMMVATLLPTAVFATEGEAADAGITITYDVTKYIRELGVVWESTPTVKFTELNYKLTNGFFNYVASSSATHETMGSNLNWNSGVIQLASGKYIAFEVFVPKAGTYKMNMYNALRGTSEVNTMVYLSRGKESTATDNMIGSYKCYGPDAGSSFVIVETPNVIDNIEIPEAGYYVFTFKAGASYGSVGTFELVCGDGSGSVLIGARTKEKGIIPNGVTHQFDLALYMNDGSEATKNYEVSYENEDTSVASISETGLITSHKEGKTTITASVVTEYGYVLKAEKEIIVNGIGITVFYDINGKRVALGIVENKTTPPPMLTELDYTTTNGFFDYVGTNHTYDGWEQTASGNAIRYGSAHIQLRKNKSMAFELNIPEAGTYDLKIRAGQSKDKRFMAPIYVYVSEGEMSTLKSDLVGEYAFYNEDSTAATDKVIEGIEISKPGKYVFTFCVASKNPDDPTTADCYQFIGNLTLTSGTHNALMGGEITSTAAEINKDNGETATVSAKGFLSSTTEATTFTYASSNPAIAEVDAETGVVTPKSEGKVTITATANGAEVANTLTKEITVTTNKPGEAVADTTVSVYIDALEGGTVETSLENTVDEVEIGTKVEATATAAEGYEFAYWSNSNGAVESTNATEIFTINVNTSIKAVFEKVVSESDATVPVYFYNGNRNLVEKADVEKGKTFGELTKPKVSLTGFAFSGWSVANETVINDVVRAVALYTDSETTYTVKVGDVTVASGKKYGESVTVSSNADNFVCWKLGEKVMSYEKNFTFDVYGDITLTEVTGDAVQAVPTVVLDTIGGENFLTYNVPAGYTKIEAGILFTTSGTPEIGSFYSKATEKTSSGQFTAKPYGATDTIARGYMIFRNPDNEVRVIYAD